MKFRRLIIFIINIVFFVGIFISCGTDYEQPQDIQAKEIEQEDIPEDHITSYFENDLSFGFEMDIGDGINSFFITMQGLEVKTGSNIFTEIPLIISIYKTNDRLNVYQTIETYTVGSLFKDLTIGDFNFDGYCDFYFVRLRGNANYVCNFWLWDRVTQKFVFNEDLGEISMPSFDSETKTVSGFWRNSATDYIIAHYKYIGDVLVCVRKLEQSYLSEDNNLLLVVFDYRNGELVEVSHTKHNFDDGEDSEALINFYKWDNPLYFGE